MGKRKEIIPPQITDELLEEAKNIFLEVKKSEEMRTAVFHDKGVKKRFNVVGECLIKLHDAWKELSAEECEWFFESVNAPPMATKLLLGEPINGKSYDMDVQPNKVLEKLDDACSGYKEYRDFISSGGWRWKFRHWHLIEFLMLHWEEKTGEPAIYTRQASGELVGVTKWVQKCLQQLEADGVSGIESASTENRVEKVYKELRKKKKGFATQ